MGLLLLSSCAFHGGITTGNASLTNANFQVVDFAVGTSSTTKVLGFGGTKKEFMVLDAKRDLYAHSHLAKGQALANVTVDFCTKNYVVFSKTKVTVSAEVVDFNNSFDSTLFIEMSDVLKSKKLVEKKGYHLREKVYVSQLNTYEKAVVHELLPNSVVVKLQDNGNGEGLLTVKYADLFKIKNSNELVEPKYSIDETIKFMKFVSAPSTGGNEKEVLSGRIKCVGYNKNYLVSYYIGEKQFESVVEESSILNQ